MVKIKELNRLFLINKCKLLLVISMMLICIVILSLNTGNAIAENNQYVGRHAGSSVSVDEAIRDALKHVPLTKKPYPQFKVTEIRVSKGSTIPKHTIVVLERIRDRI